MDGITGQNVELNRSVAPVRTGALDWDEATLPTALQLDATAPLLVLASDVCYNVGSHASLLRTMRTLLARPQATALLAYRPRSDGDGAFFDMARDAGVSVDEVEKARWNDIRVFRLSDPTFAG